MRSLSCLFLALALFSMPLMTGCSTAVDTSPAVGDPATQEADSTSGMTEEEKAEFEAGESGA